MRQKQRVFSLFLLSPSSRRAWIEIDGERVHFGVHRSPSSRRAWIEITPRYLPRQAKPVALLTEGVDRNIDGGNATLKNLTVALLTEGVDRNPLGWIAFPANWVALLTEGVDRNDDLHRRVQKPMRRPPHGGRG